MDGVRCKVVRHCGRLCFYCLLRDATRVRLRVPVSGKVLIDGQPLKFGAVMFVPAKGRGSSGVLDENGHFVLSCYDQNDGALVGTHHVRIIGGKQINDLTTQWFAPKKYSETKTSGLTQDISGPTDSIVFNLTWKGDEHGKPYIEKLDGGGAGKEMRVRPEPTK